MSTICGANCNNCGMKQKCKGCLETGGHPFGCECVVAKCYKRGGKEAFLEYKNQIISEFNSLNIQDMPKISELCALCGVYVNLEYSLPNGQKVKLLQDDKIYLGYQVEKKNSDKCYGLVADNEYLLLCEYGYNASDPQIVVYKRR